MDGSGAGTAIMLVVAAAVWFLYLVPTWLRRREYLATERTATRLQQTMRVLAETAELPDEVRLAATAREAARQERILHARERRADAMAARQFAAVRRSAPASAPPPSLAPDVLRRRRMRRTRRLASLLMVVATVAGLGQVWLIATTGMAPGAWVVVTLSVAAGATAIAVQRRLDARSMPLSTASPRSRTEVQVRDAVIPSAPVVPWTPVEMPRPLYLSHSSVEPLAPRHDVREALAAAVSASEETLRAAHAAPEVTPLRAGPTKRASRYAAMGVLGADATETPDLDEVLRRRRSVG